MLLLERESHLASLLGYAAEARHGQVVAMRACRDRAEAAARAGLGPP